MDNRLQGYQRLEQDFFRLCLKRKIKGLAKRLGFKIDEGESELKKRSDLNLLYIHIGQTVNVGGKNQIKNER